MLQIENLSVAYDEKVILEGIDLDIKRGEIACILGPSGCGKTSLLRAVAGFLHTDIGSISINGDCVQNKHLNVAPNKRSVGLIFQDFALFPHMTVQENVAFGVHELTQQERMMRVEKYMKLTGILGLAKSYPSELSGGQQQRVAIARALAPEPELLLMDEAFSSLDPSLREQVAQDIRGIIKQQGLTALLVTHDQTEAFAFADRIAVLAEGKLQQYSSAYDLYHRPKSFFVAKFVGEGAFIAGKVEIEQDLIEQSDECEDQSKTTSIKNKHQSVQTEQQSSADNHLPRIYVNTVLGRFLLEKEHQLESKHGTNLEQGSTVNILLRPDDIQHDDTSPFKAIIQTRHFRGAYIRYTLLLEQSGELVLCLAPSHHNHCEGEAFGIRVDVEHLIYF